MGEIVVAVCSESVFGGSGKDLLPSLFRENECGI